MLVPNGKQKNEKIALAFDSGNRHKEANCCFWRNCSWNGMQACHVFSCIRHFETSGYICFSYRAGGVGGHRQEELSCSSKKGENRVSEPSSRLWFQTNLALSLSFEFLSYRVRPCWCPVKSRSFIIITMRIRRNRAHRGPLAQRHSRVAGFLSLP